MALNTSKTEYFGFAPLLLAASAKIVRIEGGNTRSPESPSFFFGTISDSHKSTLPPLSETCFPVPSFSEESPKPKPPSSEIFNFFTGEASPPDDFPSESPKTLVCFSG
ncbi:hypothetical protein Fmac_018872 [Flemingia macrophylla]|uniref:Uncharacterized protein n=1 Tax=Flemingia macrophylla TaxID=520843 RepID=A0ABD1M6C0_9FABA